MAGGERVLPDRELRHYASFVVRMLATTAATRRATVQAILASGFRLTHDQAAAVIAWAIAQGLLVEAENGLAPGRAGGNVS